jgi:Predicted membrane protein
MGESLRWPIPVILTAVATLAIVPAAFSGYNSVDNAEQVLSTLASVQAAAFAIVFSVIILGIQLSTSRYATRLADLFRSDAVYKKTVGVFGLSILLDIIALTLVNDVSDLALRYLVTAAIILAVISFFILYFFVDRILEQTTPEGIIKRVKYELTPSQIVADAEAANSDSSERDPFLVPVSIIRSAISDRDVPAATQGLNVIDNQVKELLKHVSTHQLEDETAVGDSVEELCTHRLPSAGEKAVEGDLDEIGEETVGTISSIGCNAVDQEHEPVVVHSSEGLTNLVGTVDFDTTCERVREKAIDDSGEMLKGAAETRLWDVAGTGIRLLGWRAAQSVTRRGPTEILKLPYGSLSMKYIPEVFEEIVDDGSDNVTEQQLFHVARRNRDRTTSKEWALWSCYASMAEITSAFIRFEIEYGEEIVGLGLCWGWVERLSFNID